MSKRNFIILIVSVVVILTAIVGFLYLRSAPSTPEGEEAPGFLSRFNPFAKTTPNPTNNNGPTEENQAPAPYNYEGATLFKVSSMPVAGYTVFQKERYKEVPVVVPIEPVAGETEAKPETKPTAPETEFVPAVRYVARVDGNIYQTFADKLDERKFSATIIPRVYEASFGAKAESVIMRYLKIDDETIATFTGSLPKELLGGDQTEGNEVKGSFLPDNISEISVSPDQSQVFYLLNVGDGVAGITAGVLGDKKVQVFDSPFTEWLTQWANSKMITLTTKPSSSVLGYMYAIDPSKKDFNKVLGQISGLTTLTSPDGKQVLYANSALSLNIYNVATGDTIPLSIRTMPDKCVWNTNSTSLFCAVPKSVPLGSYPDSWYRGEVSFSDSIWRVDAESGSAVLVLEITALLGEDIDGIKLTLDASEKYLFFVNKKDSYLWKLDLN